MNKLKFLLILSIMFTQLACSVFGIRSEETPRYTVLASEGNKEIRKYEPYIVAKTTVKGTFKDSQNEAFRILAGYIFGKNEKKQNISMTAPVVQTAQKENVTIAMTAPVVQSQTSSGWEMTFMMPSKYKLEDLPQPLDKRITFEQVPSKILGVIKFSGFWSESNIESKTNELRSWLDSKKEYKITSTARFAGYDPPWTIPFLRRNEMMFDVNWSG